MRIHVPLLAFTLAAAPALAEERLLLSFHGRLIDAADQPVNGALPLRFALYPVAESPQAGQPVPPVWTATYEVTVAQGLFAVLLGDESQGGAPLTDTLFAEAPLWLGVAVDEGPELRPRHAIGTVPRSVRAQVAQRAQVAADAELLGGETPASYRDAARLTGVAPAAVLGTGSTALSTLGTVTEGTWQGTPVADAYVGSAGRWDAKLDAVAAGAGLSGDGTPGAPLAVRIGSEAGTVAAGDDGRFSALGGRLDALEATAPSLLTRTEADGTFLAKGDAASTYLARGDAAATYLAKGDAASTYLPREEAESAYLQANAAASTYLTREDAEATYQPKGPGSTLTQRDATLAVDEALTVTHPADPGRVVTVLGRGASAVFYADAEGTGADAISGGLPTFYDGNARIADGGRFGAKSFYARDYLTHVSWAVPAGTLDFGTGDFTIRLWFKTGQGFVSGGYWGNFLGTVTGSGGGGGDWVLGLLSLGGLRVTVDGNLVDYSLPSKYAANTWYHLAVERSSGTLRFYLDGTVRNSFALAGAVGSASKTRLYLGCLLDWDNVPDMYFDEVELLKEAVYGGDAFTPPSAPAPGSDGWRVLGPDAVEITYVDDTTTRVRRLSNAPRELKVAIRTWAIP